MPEIEGTFHGSMPVGTIHIFPNFIFANTAARTGASVTSGDVGKAGWQQDDNSFWVLVDDSPVTWAPLAGDAAATIAAHIADTTAAHNASAIAVTPGGTVAGTDAQTAILEVASDAVTREGVLAAATAAHVADTANPHAVTKTQVGLGSVDNTADSGKPVSTAQAAADAVVQAAVDAHVADSGAAHAASAIAFTPNGSIAATDVQAAIQEVRDEAVGGGGDAAPPEAWPVEHLRIAGAIPVRSVAAITSAVIGFVGDSITEQDPGSAGTPPTKTIALLTGDGVTVTADNQGVGGSTTTTWLPGDASDYLTDAKASFASDVRIVSVMLGANDAGGSVSADDYRDNLEAICADLVAAGYLVVLNVPMYRTGSSAFVLAYGAEIPKLTNGSTILMGDRAAYDYFAAHTGELSDGLHPDATGATSLAGLWAAALLPYLRAITRTVTLGEIPPGAEGQVLTTVSGAWVAADPGGGGGSFDLAALADLLDTPGAMVYKSGVATSANYATSGEGASVSAPHTFDDVAANGVDGNSATFWGNAGGVASTYDFTIDFAVERLINLVHLNSFDSTFAEYGVTAFTLRESPNGSDWTDVPSGSFSGIIVAEDDYTFPPIATRYLRLHITDWGTNGGPACREIGVYFSGAELLSLPTDGASEGNMLALVDIDGVLVPRWEDAPSGGGGSGLVNPMTTAGALIKGAAAATTSEAVAARGATFSASAVTSGKVADNAFDGIGGSNYWFSASPIAGQWLRADLGTIRTITSFRVVHNATYYPSVYKVQYCDDDATWLDAHSIAGWTGGDTGVIALASEIAARYWRFLAVTDGGGNNAWIVEDAYLYSGSPAGTPEALVNPGAGTFILKSIDGVVQWV